jgi:hypothetical protein
MTPVDCGIQIVHDREGHLCGRLGSEVCSDCGTTLCAHHSEACEFCLQVFCDCRLYFHAKLPHVKQPSPIPIGTLRRSA